MALFNGLSISQLSAVEFAPFSLKSADTAIVRDSEWKGTRNICVAWSSLTHPGPRLCSLALVGVLMGYVTRKKSSRDIAFSGKTGSVFVPLN